MGVLSSGVESSTSTTGGALLGFLASRTVHRSAPWSETRSNTQVQSPSLRGFPRYWPRKRPRLWGLGNLPSLVNSVRRDRKFSVSEEVLESSALAAAVTNRPLLHSASQCLRQPSITMGSVI